MKEITTFGLLMIVTSMIFTGVVNAEAQADIGILLQIAKRAQNELKTQISGESTSEIKNLYENGVAEVNRLEQSVKGNETQSAKKHFLSAMEIFKKISQSLKEKQTTQSQSAEIKTPPPQDYSSDIKRITKHIQDLKNIAKKHNAPIDFSQLDNLLVQANEQLNSRQYENARETIEEIKKIVVDINKNIRDYAETHENTSAKKYAQQYTEQLDRLIENAKNKGVSNEIIQKLEQIREKLSLATNPHEIIQLTKEIISIKKQFELTKNDIPESKIMQIEKTIQKLSQLEVDQERISEATQTLDKIKKLLKEGQINEAMELLNSLNNNLDKIMKEIS